MSSARSITETPNALSANIDLQSPLGIVRILEQTDAQIFSGFENYPRLGDPATLENLASLARRAAQTIKSPKGRIVLSGAGTSGRLAMFGARVFNLLHPRAGDPVFRYLIAGHTPALIQAQEGAEDSPTQGIADLDEVTAGATDIFYVGITCGLSAPYIAGQLEHLLPRENAFSVLMGFNTVELARNTPIENWHHSFRDTAEMVDAAPNAALLNPVIGPEPITGSTRMKSGSATKILVEILFHAALRLARGEMQDTETTDYLRGLIVAYGKAVQSTYAKSAEIANLVELGGKTLRAHGHIYYLGAAGLNQAGEFVGDTNAGILGLIDASECPPTYGADFEDVRGFLKGGWEALLPGTGSDLSPRGGHFQIAIGDFVRGKLPSLTENDIVVLLGDFAGRDKLLPEIAAKKAAIADIRWDGSAGQGRVNIALDGSPHPELGAALLELQIKLVINALTTGAHVLVGKVFGNRMVDLRISNNKLFHRTVGIIGDLMKVSPETARESLLKSAFQTDQLTAEQANASISDCIEAAKHVEKVVPKALLLSTGAFNVASASAALRENPIVRSVLEKHIR
ncbi:MAG: hypothetical protein K1X53_08735 [Candidatus Sumerlaeaceae bacterium]|nr:hypothetical protein [Candidatus Sumerlaeaceae bacterium]